MYVAVLKEHGNSTTNQGQRSIVLAIHFVCNFVMKSSHLELSHWKCLIRRILSSPSLSGCSYLFPDYSVCQVTVTEHGLGLGLIGC